MHKNGRIWASSDGEGMGCDFCIELPLAAPHRSSVDNDSADNSILMHNVFNRSNSATTDYSTELYSFEENNEHDSLPSLCILVVDDSKVSKKGVYIYW